MTSEESEWDRSTRLQQGYYNGRFQKPAVYVLERERNEHGEDRPGTYLLKRQISYVTKDGSRRWTVPAEKGQPFRTDLASVPALASWLVPKDGSHTPAALVHDAMVLGAGEGVCYRPATPIVDREDADRIFREGMQHLGVRFIRRWLMWAAVSIPTFWSSYGHYWVRRAMILPLGAFIVIGVFGVPDVFDVPGEFSIPSCIPLIGDKVLAWQLHGLNGTFRWELVCFLGISILGSMAYALLWAGSRWQFGLVSGLALSFLSFPIAVTAVPFLLYRCLEELIAFVLLRLQRKGRYEGRVRSAIWVERASRL